MIVYKSKKKVLVNAMENISDNVLFEIKRIELDYESDTYTISGTYSSTTRLLKPVNKRVKKGDTIITFSEEDVKLLSVEMLTENSFWGLGSDDYEIKTEEEVVEEV